MKTYKKPNGKWDVQKILCHFFACNNGVYRETDLISGIKKEFKINLSRSSINDGVKPLVENKILVQLEDKPYPRYANYSLYKIGATQKSSGKDVTEQALDTLRIRYKALSNKGEPTFKEILDELAEDPFDRVYNDKELQRTIYKRLIELGWTGKIDEEYKP